MSLLISPTIKRPTFHIFGQNRNVIRGGTVHRCIFCGAMLPAKEEFCSACNSTQVSIDAELNGKAVKDSPIWKQRFKKTGNPRGGYEGSI